MSTDCVPIRHANSDTAIAFVHGFGGSPTATWAQFPALLAAQTTPPCAEADIFCLGYSSRLQPDLLRGLWTSDPELRIAARQLATCLRHGPLQRHAQIALIAHSMGGLVVQRMLLDEAALRARISHVLLFGTPSGGLLKARLGRWLKRQFRDMAIGGAFVAELRQRWNQAFPHGPQTFRFHAVAGDRDEFVPATSSLDPFPQPVYAGRLHVVAGDHLSIVKPDGPQHPSVQLALSVLADQTPASSLLPAAISALQAGRFDAVIAQLWPQRLALSDEHKVQLALALDGNGRHQDAIELLEHNLVDAGTDAIGTLAGRHKRLWWSCGLRAAAERADRLYRQAWQAAEVARDAAQSHYHAINLAFLALAHRQRPAEAKRWAQAALAACRRAASANEAAATRKWRLASAAEAQLHLRRFDAALQAYEEATCPNLCSDPRELHSMYLQAREIALRLAERSVIQRLERIFSRAARRAVTSAPALNDASFERTSDRGVRQ